MPNTFDLAAELATGVQDRHRAWVFIRGFAQAWLTPLRDEDGYSGGELNAAEERLGFRLPAALREAYMLFGKRADLCGTMNFLQPPDRLYMYEDTGLLLYHAENQENPRSSLSMVNCSRRRSPRSGLIIRGRTPEIVDTLYKALPTEWFHWEQDW